MWKVMIADDEPFIREGIEQLIPWKELGCRLLYSASNGKELIEYMEHDEPDIVIVDIKMPVLGGLDVAAYIQEKQLDIKVIILTAYADFQYAHQAIRYNASDYIVKSSALEDIPQAIGRITKKLEESRFASFRLILLYGTAEKEALQKMARAAFEEMELKQIEANQRQSFLIIAGSRLTEEELVYNSCKKLRELSRNFLQKNLEVGISPVFHDIKQVPEYYADMTEFVKEQMAQKETGIFWKEKQTVPELSVPEDSASLIRQVDEYVEQNFCSRISLDDIAEEVHVNRSYLSRIYKQKTGFNLFDTINMKRIQLAKQCIRENKMKMYEIAVQVGFEDTAYFSKVFKKFEGISPKEFSRMNGQEKGKPAIKSSTALKSLLLLFICLCTCVSCQQPKAQQTEITLIHGWGAMDKDHVTMRSIYEDFERKNPDININLVSMPSSEEVVKKVNDMMAVGKIPDLVFTAGFGKDSLYRFVVDKGYAVDFMPYMEADPEFKADLAPEIFNYWETENGELYTVSDVLLLSGGYWYNKEILKAAGISKIPETWEEFLEACDRIEAWADKKKEEIIPLQVNLENSAYLADALIMKRGGTQAQVLMDKGLYISGEEFAGVLQDFRKVYSYSYATNEDYGYRDALSLFNEGKLAMYINGVWANQMISSDISAEYTTLPSDSGQSIACSSACLGFIVGDTGNKETIDASVRFVKYMVSDEVQKRILKETGQVPSNPAVKISEYAEEMPRLYQAVQVVQEAGIKIEVPDNLWPNEKLGVFHNGIIGVLKGEIPELDFIDQIK